MGKSRAKPPRRIPAARPARPRSHSVVKKQRPQTIPLEYGGKWIAWDKDMVRIVAHADTFAQVREQVRAGGIAGACYQKVPTPAQIRAHGKG